MFEAKNEGASCSSFRDSLGSVDSKGRRVFFYPKKPKGRFYNSRAWLSYVLLALMFAGPLLRVNGHPLILFNILEPGFQKRLTRLLF